MSSSLGTENFSSQFVRLAPALSLGFPFKPTNVGGGYLGWPLLPEIFPLSSPGVNTSRDLDLVGIDLTKLRERVSAYFDSTLSDHQIKTLLPSLMSPSARYDPVATRRYLLNRGEKSGHFVRYCYRPFDVRFAYWPPETKLIDEKREDLFSAVRAGNLFLTSRQKAERQTEGTPFYVATCLADRHLTRPGGNCFPWKSEGLLSPKQSELGAPPKQLAGLTANLSAHAHDYLCGLGINNADADPETASLMWMHALAIGYSPAYLRENADGIRQDWPRIPMPDTKDALVASAELGRRIAGLLDTEVSIEAAEVPSLPVIGAFRLAGQGPLDETEHFTITAGWGHLGSGGITMPAKGRTVERDLTAQERESMGEAVKPLGDRTLDVYLNESAYWANIPARVWDYTIGGYQVIKKWLSYREQKLLGRPLRKDEVRYVQEMARRIAAILLLEPDLDANYEKVKRTPPPWVTSGRG